jgi:hypothetical protein
MFRITVLVAVILLFVGIVSACRGDGGLGTNEDALTGPVPCMLSSMRYPTVPSDMGNVYQGRSFYADGNHLGLDIALPEATPIHPVGCGILRVYRSASGYGQLVAVVEHTLANPITVLNGKGEQVSVTSFLSIYGHLRKSADRAGLSGLLGFKPGDAVGPDDVIGYVNDDLHNGDGAEHLHLGIRLQSALDAQATEVNWFRGYDTEPSQRRWFADPVLFLATLTSSIAQVFWHPPGTFIRRPSDGALWYVDGEIMRHPVDVATVSAEKLVARSVDVTDAELGCMTQAAQFASPRAGRSVVKFDDASTVYEYRLDPPAERRAFISYDAFQSWGWKDADITIWPASLRPAFFAAMPNLGIRTFRDGALVKAQGESEVAVVSEGRRLPIADWPTFLALGYRPEHIVTVPSDTIDLVAGPRGLLITSELAGYCVHPSACVVDCPPSGQGGGTGEEIPSDIPPGKIRFRYDGPVLPGSNEFQGMWDPPGDSFYDWTPATSALCPDLVPGDGSFECFLDIPSGSMNFLFTVKLPDERWWGDLTCTPTGGCGSPIGQVTLEGPSGSVAYELVSNGSGLDYRNGFVAVLP